MQESTSPSSNQESDEITLKDIILKIQQWWTILWPQRTKIILTALAIGLMAAMYTKFISKPTYTASYQLFFEEDGGSMSSAMRLASSFGLSMGGSGATSSITVQEYLTSRDNISKAMTMVSGQGVMAERYYEYALYEDQEFNEMFYANFGKNQRYTDSILSEITLELNEGFIAASLDEESGTVNFAINGYDEAFVYDLSKALIANTEDAFLDWKKKKGQSAVEAFQGKVDSLEIALDATLRRLGEYQDQNNSLISAVDKMEQMRLSIDMEALKVAYGEYIKGLEMSKADLMNLEPPFKYFDEPTYPLYKEEGSAVKAGIFGSVITGFLLLLFFIGRVEAKSIMAD
jgi:hypothetical protein